MSLNYCGNILYIDPNIINLLNSFTGMVCYYAMEDAPAGWLVCDGSTLSQSTYANLYSKIGDTYSYIGTPTASQFCLPDLRGEHIRGYDSAGGVPRGLDPSTYSEVATTTINTPNITALATNGEIGIGWLITSSVANVIPPNTRVKSIGSTGTTVVMTKNALLTNSTQTLTFTRVFGAGEQDCVQDHTHGLGTGSSFQGGGSATAVDGSGTNRFTSGVRNGVGYRSYTETRPTNVALLPCIKY